MATLRTLAILTVGAMAATPAAAQRWQLDCRDDRDDDDWGRRFCSVEERTLRGGGAIRIDAHPNGGVAVFGSDRDDVELRAKVTARARTEDRAEEIARAVRIVTAGGEIRAEGPRTSNREWWSVSFELHVPRNTDLAIETQNGGIEVEDVRGEMNLRTQNGGLSLRGLAGDVRARTQNGGVDVELVGRRWEGPGLDVQTQNGGVDLAIPERYSAELEAGTQNGGIDFDFPVTVRGRLTRRITTTLGDGGPPVRVVTTNGGVTVRRA